MAAHPGFGTMNEEAIFLEALQKPTPEARAAFLDVACVDHPELRLSVNMLLKAHERAGGFLENVPHLGVATIDEPAVAERPGTVIGPYKLLEQIGEGGFGVVFMAEQQQPIRRKVALKILKPGMDTRQVVARFEAERQALALMDHPNIARVIDGGETASLSGGREPPEPAEFSDSIHTQGAYAPRSGRPYFVMELVRGTPITEFCDQNHLSVRDRLELFVDVCQAVQHAHQKGIIHRDLKPTNVMVAMHDDKPVVKVIDFGVAKAMGQQLTDKTLFTNFAQLIGTPLYMSPEQAGQSSLDADTRSDIYSLGVLLYELLTGTTPFDKERLRTVAYDEMRRIILEEEPPRPSTRMTTQGQAASTASVNRKSDPKRLYQLFRGELDWIVMKCLEKDRNRRYETASTLAADVRRYLADEPVQACPPSAGYRLGKFVRRNKRALAAAMMLGVALLVAVGAVAGSLGWVTRDRAARQTAVELEVNLALKEAEQLQEQAKWPEALSAAKRAEGLLAGGGSEEFRERAHQLRKDLEMVLRLEEIPLISSEMKESKWDWQSADGAYAKAFADYGIDVAGLPADEAAAQIRAPAGLAVALVTALDYWTYVRSQNDRAGGLALLAVAQAADPDAWRRQVREAVKQKDGKILAALAASPELLRQPPASLLVLTRGLSDRGLAEAAIEVLRQAQQQYPGDFLINWNLAGALHRMGPPHRDEAISFCRAALAVRPQSSWAHSNVGAALHYQQKLPEASAAFRKAIEIDPKNAIACNNLGLTLNDQGKLDEAIAWSRKAIELEPTYANAHNTLGMSLADLGRLDEAIACYRKAIELDPKFAPPHSNLGNALHDQKKLDEAIAALRKAIKLDPKLAEAHNSLGVALRGQGKLDQAITCYHKAIELEPKFAAAHKNLGIALQKQQKFAEAIACFRKAIELEPKSAWAHSALAWLIATCTEAEFRDPKQAVELAKKAIELEPKSAIAWQYLGWVQYRARNWKASIQALEESCKLQKGGDCCQWIVMSLAHGKLATEKELTEQERDRHQAEARRWYDEAVNQINTWGPGGNSIVEATRTFRAEAAEMLGVKEKQK